ncbi:hypothetical protein CHS0354_032982 [Potamilus streckersoni]|uniref:PNPLA domain-containing protein n=1 Tax=Potamilus streckersoni TaxID=2493646 RepID=A0AAE0RX35_9BIVA|nr:hypothetical protein CHS0354_032982 [Potamilus streckersoni]
MIVDLLISRKELQERQVSLKHFGSRDRFCHQVIKMSAVRATHACGKLLAQENYLAGSNLHQPSTYWSVVNQTNHVMSTMPYDSHQISKQNSSDKKDEQEEDSKTPYRTRNPFGTVMSTLEYPVKWLTNYDKVSSIVSQVQGKFRKDTSRLTNTLINKKNEIKQLERNRKNRMSFGKLDESVNRERHSLEQHIEDMNRSIISFYDTTAMMKQKTFQPPVSATTENITKTVAKNIIEKDDKEEESKWPYLTDLASYFVPQKQVSIAKAQPKKHVIRQDFVSQSELERRTRDLVYNLKTAASNMSKLKRAEELCKHLLQYPDMRTEAIKEKVLPCLFKMRQSKDNLLQMQALEGLALIGSVPPLRGRGIRLLTIDGGGTRGLVAIETLRQLEQMCQTELAKLFDYACGVSTGALIVALVFIFRIPLTECEELYKEMSRLMFTRNKYVGTGKLVWNHAFYDAKLWEEILRTKMGEKRMIDFSRDPVCPKISAMSTVINVPKMKNFLFRNYNHPSGIYSQYPGNCKHKMWEVIRASSAAPGYFEEFVLGDYVHQDGGILSNNPTAVGLHECKLLWPDQPIQCVISIGTGRYEPNLEIFPTKSSLRDKVTKIVDSATDTEAVHVTMKDLLPPKSYFRFNPYLSEDCGLDEIRPERIQQMQTDTQLYLRKNQLKVAMAARELTKSKLPHQYLVDWAKHRLDMIW